MFEEITEGRASGAKGNCPPELRTYRSSDAYHHCEKYPGQLERDAREVRRTAPLCPARRSRQAGFTLLEMLVTIAIFGAAMIMTANLLVTIFTNSTTDPSALNAVDQAESAATNFVNQLRDATYGNDGSYPLAEASTTEIIFFSPYGSAGSTTVDRIRYFVSSSTLYEGITAPSGSPSSYNLANEKVTAVVNHVSGNGTSTVFLYYNGGYAGTSSALSQPVNVNQVTYVGLNIAVQLQEVRGSAATSSISTGAAIRNLKTNLGD